MLRYCVISKLMHIARNLPPDLVRTVAQRFDVEVKKSFCYIAGLKGFESTTQAKQMRLPIRLGGIGLPNLDELLEGAFVAAHSDVLRTAEQDFPQLWDSWQQALNFQGTTGTGEGFNAGLNDQDLCTTDTLKDTFSSLAPLRKVAEDAFHRCSMDQSSTQGNVAEASSFEIKWPLELSCLHQAVPNCRPVLAKHEEFTKRDSFTIVSVK